MGFVYTKVLLGMRWHYDTVSYLWESPPNVPVENLSQSSTLSSVLREDFQF